MQVSVAVEGLTDESVALRLLALFGHQHCFLDVAGGKGALDPKLTGYNNAAKGW